MDLRGLITFPIARYRLEWRASTPVQIPDYAGSMLRGAFGHALRQSACMTGEKDCGGGFAVLCDCRCFSCCCHCYNYYQLPCP